MSTTDLPGSSLLAGRYRLVERLGAGGMSVVWRGFDEVLGRQVAVKVLPPSTSADPAFRRRLRAEAQAAARLSHPNITNVYDYGEATTVDGEPVPYVVMELIDGESLAAVLARVRKLPWQHAVRITAEVAAALAAAHSRGIVHRDVTPANVMLTATGAKVVDFGISALIGENDIDPDGSLLGTPAYLAPERLEGGQVSPATDVYAVGLLIYRTLIGQLPWDVGTTTALLRAHQYTEPEPLPPVEDLPPEVDALVGRCLEKRPADRPSSAELAHILAAISAGAPSVARGYVPDWAGAGEDTTILPSPQSYAEILALAAAAQVSPAAAPASAAPVSPAAPESAAEAAEAAPARNSRFGELPSGPVYNAAPAASDGGLRPAVGNQPPPPPDKAAKSSAPSWAGGSHTKTRRILVVALGVLLLGIGTYGWSLTGGPTDEAKGATPAPATLPPEARCVVSYAVWSDTKGRFKAQVTVANRNETPVKDWQLWFIMPGDQIVSGDGDTSLTQSAPKGGSITVGSESAIEPLKTVSLPISGRYKDSNTPPMAFSLNGAQCETFVSAKPGEPSRYVQHLANGQAKLGPTTSPIPGISVGPGGIITVTPTTGPPTTTKPGGGGDPVKGPPPSTDPGTTTEPPVIITTPPTTTTETVPPTPPPTTSPPPETTLPPTPPPTTAIADVELPPGNPGDDVGEGCEEGTGDDC
ncbi:serine/threonine-protein kinase [Paractinoplanes hotanensis]|uniref:non-specific serine/threonine protein kinase n=1 Tax=Paractinoplanes hotanensis TaxID=2906497 RepID=A0ABT0XZM6_9ACTN|nr:serine/threonine-protein kinase [Actinoplanes hotanensis]MCM4079080.1 protein kinase [Actinoplanes hotanensis]